MSKFINETKTLDLSGIENVEDILSSYPNFNEDALKAEKLIIRNVNEDKFYDLLDKFMEVKEENQNDSVIKELDFSYSGIEDDMMSIVECFSETQVLNLEGCQNISSPLFENELPNLRKINLSGSQITDAGLKKILDKCPNIEEINLSDCENILDSKLRKKLETQEIANLRSPLAITLMSVADKLGTSFSSAVGSYLTREDLTELSSVNKSLRNIEKYGLRKTMNLSKIAANPNDYIPDQGSQFNYQEFFATINQSDQLIIRDRTAADTQLLLQSLLADIIPTKGLSELKKIDLSGSQITDEDLKNILDHCPNLEEIDLINCYNLSTPLLTENLSKLKKIDLSVSQITDEDLKKILDHCPNLEEIYLRYCAYFFTPLLTENLAKLKKIDLANSLIRDEGLKNIFDHCQNLEEIDLVSCYNLSTPLLTENLSKLKKIDLSKSWITDEGLKNILDHCPNLEEINLVNCYNLLTPLLTENLSKLKKIDLSKSRITDEGLKNILDHCPNLEEINLEDCQYISNSFAFLKENLSKLKKINLSESGIRDTGLRNILDHCPNLEEINLGHYHNLSTHLLITENLSKLKKIDFSQSGIRDKSLKNILDHCPNLEEIDLVNCYNLSTPLLTENLSKLKKIDLSKSRITDEGLKNILDHCPNLEEIYLRDCDHLSNHLLKEKLSRNIATLRSSLAPSPNIQNAAASQNNVGNGHTL